MKMIDEENDDMNNFEDIEEDEDNDYENNLLDDAVAFNPGQKSKFEGKNIFKASQKPQNMGFSIKNFLFFINY